MRNTKRSLLFLLIPALIAGAAIASSFTGSAQKPQGFVGEYIPDQTTLAECAAGVSDFTNCWYQAFANLTYAEGVPAAFVRLEAEIGALPEVNKVCHIITHGIGAGGYLRSGGDLAQTVAGGSDICGGFYHGVMIQALKNISDTDPEIAAREMVETCLDKSTFPLDSERTSCMHGAGHALMVRNDNDLPAMLEVCDEVESRELGMGYYCALGVTMENFISSWGFERRWLKEGDPMYPCNALAPRYKAACYGGIIQLHIQLVGTDPDALGDLCRTAEPDWAAYCMRQAYADLDPSEWQTPGKIIARCEKVAPYGRVCLWSAINGLAARGGGSDRLALAEGLCALSPDGPLGEACAYAIGAQLNEGVEIERLCASFRQRPTLDRWCRDRSFPNEGMRDLGIFIYSENGVNP